MPLIPPFTFPVISPDYINIALLNVRSLMPKLSDLKLDMHISPAILCLTETWLTEQHASPLLFPDHAVLRCDRTCGENRGGVLISVHHSIQTLNVT